MEWPSPRSHTRRETLRYAALAVSGAGVGASTRGSASGAAGTTHLPADAPKVDPRWTASVIDDFLYLPSVVGNTVVAESESHAYGFGLDRGDRQWRTTGTSGTVASTGHGRAYAVDGTELRAVDPASGKPAWTGTLPVDEVPHVLDVRTTAERVVAVVPSGLYGFDAASGAHQWSLDAHDVLRTTEPTHTSRAYVRDGGRLSAHDLRTGERRWTVETPAEVQALVADDGEVGYFSTADGVLALDSETGERRWQWTNQGETPFYGRQGAVVGGTLFVPGERGGGTTNLFALSTENGRHRWTLDADADVEVGYGGPVVSDGVVFLVEGVRTVSAVDASSGERRWSTNVGSDSPTGILDVHGDVVYHPTDAGLFALDAADGTVRWRYPVRAALYACVRDGVVFVGVHGGRLLAFDPRGGPLDRVLGTLTAHPLAALGVGGLLGGALWAGARARRTRSAADADTGKSVTVLRTTDRRTVSAVTEDGATTVRTEFVGQFDEDARDAFTEGMATWTGLDGVTGVCPVTDWGTDPTPWYETEQFGEYTLADADDWESAVHALVRVCTALDTADERHGDLRTRDVLLVDPADGTDAVVGGWGLDSFRRREWGDDPVEAPTAAPGERETGPTTATTVYRVGAIGKNVLDAFVVPEEVRDVLDRATATDPADRYDALADLRVDLRWAAFAR